MRALGDLKITMEELLVALGNIVKAYFRLFFKVHQNSILFFSCNKLSFEQICP
jgi:hypothetical protein